MAYTSRAWASGWTYDRNGEDFNAKVGNLLNGGADLQAAIAAAALAATSAELHNSCPAGHMTNSAQVNANPYERTSSHKTCIGPHPGYAWVDEQGRPLAIGPPATAALATAAVTATGQQDQQHTSTGHKLGSSSGSSGSSLNFTAMNATQRSKTIWKRISPGMLPDTSATPQPTTAEAHAYKPELNEPTDFTHHLKKTDFGEYTECALRHMHHIKAAKK